MRSSPRHRLAPAAVLLAAMLPLRLAAARATEPPHAAEAGAEPPATALTFPAVIDEALAASPALALARATQAAQAGRRLAARGRLLPTLEVGVVAGHTAGRVQGSFGDIADVDFSTYGAPAWAVTLDVNPGAEIGRAAAASTEAEAAASGVAAAAQCTLLDAVTLYQSVALAQRGVTIASEIEADSAELLRLVLARFDAGVGEGVEVERARARLAHDATRRLRAEGQWRRASAELAALLGRDPVVLLGADGSALEVARWLADPAASPDGDGALRPDLAALRLEAAAAEKRTDAAGWDLLGPRFGVAARGQLLGDSWDDLDPGRRVEARLFWTLGPEGFGARAVRRAEADAARVRRDAGERRAAAELEAARSAARAALAAAKQARTGEDAAWAAHELTMARFQAGFADALEAIVTEDALAQARFALAQAIAEANVAQAELLAAAGRIDRDGLLAGYPAQAHIAP